MKKSDIVKSKIEFNNIMQLNQSLKNKYFIIFKKENNLNKPLFGIAVGKKIGSAVVRNKLKRQLRMIITSNKRLFKTNFSYIILIKKRCLNLSYQELTNNLINLIEKDNI